MANDGTQHLKDDLGTLLVFVWDLGPARPVQPKRPEAPKGVKEGTPEFDLAMIEFEEVKDRYARDLATYRTQRDEYEKWQADMGGPVERMMWSVDARDAMNNDKNRYTISSRTRGYDRLPNRGLPAGAKPGHGQKALEERERQGLADFEAARKADPIFGQEVGQHGTQNPF